MVHAADLGVVQEVAVNLGAAIYDEPAPAIQRPDPKLMAVITWTMLGWGLVLSVVCLSI